MKFFVRWSVLVALLLTLAGQALAVEKQGTAAVKFLTLDTSARMAGVGSSASSYTDWGGFSALINQASMVFVQGKGAVGVTYARYIADMTLFSGGVVWNLGDNGAIGFGFHSLLSGDMPFATSTDPTRLALQGQNFTVTDLAFGPAYARRLTDAFSVGASFKFISEGTSGAGIYDRTVKTIAFDAGTIYTTDFHKFRIGATFQNFGSDIGFIPTSNLKQTLPTTFRIGFAGEPAALPVGSLMLSAEIWKLREFDSVLNFGAEYWVNNYISGRIGWKFGYSGSQDEGVSAGTGIKFNQGSYKIGVDYAFTQFTQFSDIHRVSIGFDF